MSKDLKFLKEPRERLEEGQKDCIMQMINDWTKELETMINDWIKELETINNE